jgi:hypothetical protein
VSCSVDGLGVGADQQAAASAACALVQEALTVHGIMAVLVGDVPAAAGFHAALTHVLSRQAADAGVESTRRADLADRAARTAGLGAGLVGDTTAAAGAVAPAGVPGGG